MPITKKGEEILSAMQKKYGAKKGKQIYFASIVKGKVSGAEGKGGTGKLAKAKKTYAKNNKSTKTVAKKSTKKIAAKAIDKVTNRFGMNI